MARANVKDWFGMILTEVLHEFTRQPFSGPELAQRLSGRS